jgi:hypothetical protein
MVAAAGRVPAQTDAAEVGALGARCREVLGPVESWVAPARYPDGLALCVLDSVWSLNVRYGSVTAVLGRYREIRKRNGAVADRDGLAQLMSVIEGCGDAAGFADAVANRQRTSTRGGILKAEAVLRCSRGLIDVGMVGIADLNDADADRLCAAEHAWRAVPGQRSGISWLYLRMLAGAQEVKPDRMIIRFVEAAIGRVPSAGEAAELVTATAQALRVDLCGLDHRIWRYQSGRLKKSTRGPGMETRSRRHES